MGMGYWLGIAPITKKSRRMNQSLWTNDIQWQCWGNFCINTYQHQRFPWSSLPTSWALAICFISSLLETADWTWHFGMKVGPCRQRNSGVQRKKSPKWGFGRLHFPIFSWVILTYFPNVSHINVCFDKKQMDVLRGKKPWFGPKEIDQSGWCHWDRSISLWIVGYHQQ